MKFPTLAISDQAINAMAAEDPDNYVLISKMKPSMTEASHGGMIIPCEVLPVGTGTGYMAAENQ